MGETYFRQRGEIRLRDTFDGSCGTVRVLSDDGDLAVYDRDKLLAAVAAYVIENEEAGKCFFTLLNSHCEKQGQPGVQSEESNGPLRIPHHKLGCPSCVCGDRTEHTEPLGN